jgi:hypothetical protein
MLDETSNFEGTEERLSDLSLRLKKEFPEYSEISIRVIDGVKIVTTDEVSEEILQQMATLYHQKPREANNCFSVSDFVHGEDSSFDSIHSEVGGHIVGGPHAIDFGNNLLVDLNFGDEFRGPNILVLPMPKTSLEPTLNDYLNIANNFYGGNWSYLGREGYLKKLKILQQERERRNNKEVPPKTSFLRRFLRSRKQN